VPPNFYNAGDQAIYSAGDFFIPQERYRAAPYTVNQPSAPDEVPAGIPTVYQPQGGGGGGYSGGVNDLIKNYTLDTRNQYFDSQKTPLVDDLYQSKLDKTFMGFPSYREQQLTGPDMGEYIGSGTDVPLELTGAGKVQNTLGNIGQGISGLANKIGGFGPISAILGSMDKFDSLSAADQEFIKQNMGYTGPTVFGDNSSGLSKDPFGINTRSAFGNYAEYVGEKSKSLGQSLQESAQKAGLSFDPVTGEVTGDDEDIEAWEKQTKLKRTKQRYYFQKENERIANEKLMEQQAAAAAAAAAAASKAESAKQYDPNKHGGTNYGLGSDGQQSYSGDSIGASGLGFGVSATGGGPVSNRTGKGRTGYLSGGLADMLEIYD
jgi:hypothetical protein